jgi:hypothetical protein
VRAAAAVLSRPRSTLARFVILLTLLGCGPAEQRFADPATTYRIYRQALAAGDYPGAWTCYSSRYRQAGLGDSAAWVDQWRHNPAAVDAELRREISAERMINDRIAYLMFDPSTLSSAQVSPFFYFVHEPDGWKITTHLDTLFHRELENAIARGEFRLPER